MSKKSLVYTDKALTGIGALAFVTLLPLSFIESPRMCLRIVLVCGVSFVLVTILRKLIDAPRPNVEGAIYNKKTGESFPSRHTFSMCIIAFSWFNLNVVVGSILCALSVALGATRVAIGAHHVRDVVGSILIAGVCACAGYLFF